MNRLIKILIILGMIGFIFLIIIRIFFPSEENRILRLIEKGRVAVEREDISTCSEILNRDYLDSWGNDYWRILRYLMGNFRVYDNIKVHLLFRKVILREPFAQCSLHVRVSGRHISYGEEIIYASPLLLSFIKENKKWYVISASE